MKKQFFLLVMFVCLFRQAFPQFIINGDPQNPNRMPDPRSELGIILQSDSPIIKVNSGSGKVSSNYLSSGVLVIIDKNTRFATWVAACGNDVLTRWVPKGKSVSFAEEGSYEKECLEMFRRLEGKITDMYKLLNRPKPFSLLELREELRKSLEGFQAPPTAGNVYTRKIWNIGTSILVGASAVVGFVAGGYLFEKEVTENKVIAPKGISAGNGTIQYGPERVETTTHREFNPVMGFLTALVSVGITVILNFLVF